MSKYQTEHINGDLLVEHDAAFGGSMEVQGDMVVHHNIRIKGSLEADNLTGANKGYYMTLSDLQENYPHPDNGWMAGVMSNESASQAVFYCYIAKNNTWVNTGKELPTGSMSIEEILELIRENQKENLVLTQDSKDPMRWYSDRPFHIGTEELLVNGVHYYTPDYSVIEGNGVGIGVIIPFYENGWEVTMVADVVESVN